jgi:adenylosuccinate lyase
MTPTIGRSHGIHAEPTTFGLKLAYAYAEFARAKARLVAARDEVSTCAISGAVGTFAQIDPQVEAHVAKAMGLRVEPVSTQVIPRDRHAMYFATLGVIASSAERLATEIRHLQRTEVLEAEEYFSEGQKGSSSMPHKRNPVLSENVTGLARMVRAYVTPALENVALWHERDISHSSAHRADRQARGLPGEHGEEPRPPGRAGAFAAHPHRTHTEGTLARGGLQDSAAARHEGLARRRRFPGDAGG